MSNLTSISAIGLALTVLALAPAVDAEPSPAESAKTHADRGMMYYNLSDWPAAIAEFRAAFEADPRPDYLFAKGQAERQSGDCQAAISSYKAFLRTSSGSSSRVTATESLIRECEEKVEETRKIEKARRLEEARKRELSRAEERAGDDAREPIVESSQPAKKAANGSWIGDPAGIALSVGGILVGAAGTTFFLFGNSAMRSSANQATYQQYESHVSTAKTERTLGLVGIGVGAALLSAGIVRYVVVASRDKSMTAQLGISPGGAFVHGQF